MYQVLRRFPDCSYVYAFFRARTLGYDVYPEDHFLRNFPWQQYGGLWIVKEARFARADPVNALTAQALRRITSVGASTHSSDSASPTSDFTNSSFGHQPARLTQLHYNIQDQSAVIPAFDGAVSAPLTISDHGNSQPVFNMGSPKLSLPQPRALRPTLALLTDVDRRYPGFPSPLSPTLSAKQLYPTPTSVSGKGAATPRVLSPPVRSTSPMSVDGSNMCGTSTRCMSRNYGHVTEQMGNLNSILAQSSQPRPSSRATSRSSACPASPQRALSPRVGMLRQMATTQTLRNVHDPVTVPRSAQHSVPTVNPRRDSVVSNSSFISASCSPSVQSLASSPIREGAGLPVSPCIQIANGTEFETGSPISPTGTMLSYTSNRAVDSGLLAVPALSEPQVAEYRFWVPCGRRACAFGCGGGFEGESAAAKKLFKEVDIVVEPHMVDEGYGFGGEDDSFEEQRADVSTLQSQCSSSSVSLTKPAEEWKKFLEHTQRDVSVAKV